MTGNTSLLQNCRNVIDVEKIWQINADLKPDDNNVVFADILILFVLAICDLRTLSSLYYWLY